MRNLCGFCSSGTLLGGEKAIAGGITLRRLFFRILLTIRLLLRWLGVQSDKMF
jgi:hypothetical protein